MSRSFWLVVTLLTVTSCAQQPETIPMPIPTPPPFCGVALEYYTNEGEFVGFDPDCNRDGVGDKILLTPEEAKKCLFIEFNPEGALIDWDVDCNRDGVGDTWGDPITPPAKVVS
jgi:hypothetical protein